MPFNGKKKYIKYLKYLHAVTQSIILIPKFGHITWACLWMYKGSVSGWQKSNGRSKRQSPRVTGDKGTSQWAARYSSKVNWQWVPAFYSTFKTLNSHHYTLQKSLTVSTLIFGPELIASPVMEPMDMFQHIHSSLVQFSCLNKRLLYLRRFCCLSSHICFNLSLEEQTLPQD